MPKYSFVIEQKVTVWEQCRYQVEAGSYEEAEARMKEEFQELTCQEDGEDGTGFIECETLYDSQEEMAVSDNGGAATRELYQCHGDGTQTLICANAPSTK